MGKFCHRSVLALVSGLNCSVKGSLWERSILYQNNPQGHSRWGGAELELRGLLLQVVA